MFFVIRSSFCYVRTVLQHPFKLFSSWVSKWDSRMLSNMFSDLFYLNIFLSLCSMFSLLQSINRRFINHLIWLDWSHLGLFLSLSLINCQCTPLFCLTFIKGLWLVAWIRNLFRIFQDSSHLILWLLLYVDSQCWWQFLECFDSLHCTIRCYCWFDPFIHI